MKKNIVFSINGGIGKCVAATAVCAAIKKANPESELIVVSGYPDVFLNNPNVSKSFLFGQTSYFYSDYLENKEFEILMHDPYLTTSYIKRDKHVIQIWCELYGIPYNGEKPELFLTNREIEYFQKFVTINKPMLLMQTNGGGDANRKYSWARDIPINVVLQVIDHFKNDYDIFHVRRDDQLSFPNTIQLTAGFRQIVATSLLSTKRLVMDSFLQHALAAMNLPSVACWVVNSPTVFGYDMHTHIVANDYTQSPELRNSFLVKFNIAGEEIEFPYENENQIFDVDKIIAALESQQ